MKPFLWFLCGFLFACAGAVLTILSSYGFSARPQPGPFETMVARFARSLAMPTKARALPNPVSDSPEVLAAAKAHWADHCAGCHAADGSGDTTMGKGTWPPTPDMRLASTQRLSDGELFFVIQNGVRFTGMPAWSTGSDHDAEDSWKLVRLIRHLPRLSPDEKKEIERLTPRTPDEFREEQEEEKFLNGEDAHESHTEHHHH